MTWVHIFLLMKTVAQWESAAILHNIWLPGCLRQRSPPVAWSERPSRYVGIPLQRPLAGHLLQRPGCIDLGLLTPSCGSVSSFICLDETKINHNSIWRLRGFFLSSTHFRFSRASASCVHETPCWLFPTLARPSTDLSGSVTRQPVKHYTVWQPFKSQKVTITILTVDVLITVD